MTSTTATNPTILSGLIDPPAHAASNIDGSIGNSSPTPAAEAAFPAFKVQLDLFKDMLNQRGYVLNMAAENTDDTTLLRFLKAQQFNLTLALQQFEHFQTWRKEHDIQSFYRNVDVNFYEESRKMYPQWTGRRDKDGDAIYVFPVRHLTKKRLDTYLKKISSCPSSKTHQASNLPPEDLHFHALYENLLHFVFPLVSELPRPDMSRDVSASTHIVDVSGVGIRQFWSIRKYLQQASTTATAHYPETMGKVFVVGAPSFFKSIWDVISQWFDPVTRSKIFLLSASEAHEVMRGYIDRANLPVEYGGDLDWAWQDLPNLDSHARRLVDNLYEKTDQGEVFAKGPLIFENGCIKLLGTVDGQPRRNDYCPR